MNVHVRVDPSGPSETTAVDADSQHCVTPAYRRRPHVAIEHCVGRQPGHTCYSLYLPGFPTCPVGHAMVRESPPPIGVQPIL